MGKSTVDLPDPLDQQQSVPAAGMDDLLAQLAGDEIDRMLAEADDEIAPAPAPRLSKDSPLAKLNELADAEIDPNQSLLPGAPPAPPEAATVPAAVDLPETETDSGLSALLNELEQDPAATRSAMGETGQNDPGLSEPASAPVQTGLLAPGAVEQVLAEEAAARGVAPALPASPAEELSPVVIDGTSAAERGALDEPIAHPDPAADALALDAEDDDEAAPLPFFLRPLEWLNAPLQACPEWARDLVGKAAIITMVNAVAVLIYVAVFRRG